MAHDTLPSAPPAVASDSGTGPEPDPTPPRGPGWLLRRLTGVDEDLLDLVPEERSRYTLQGLVVVGTATLAGLAVFVALDRFTTTPGLLLVPAALFWAGLILVFDCWLLSTTQGVKESRRPGVFLGRVILTVVISLVVAEPLLLYVFRPSVEQEVEVTRQREEDAYRSALERCNPMSGDQSTDPDCTQEYLLTVGDSTLSADRSALADAVAERDRVREQVEELQEELAERQELARMECGGESGAGLTGRVGEGPNCQRLRQEADGFEESSRLASHQANLLELNDTVEELTNDAGDATTEFAVARAELIDAKVEERAAEEGEHGVIDEMAALHELSRNSVYVLAGVILLRLLLVAVDLLPILTKVLSPTSTYDELYTAQRALRADSHSQTVRIARKRTEVATDREIGELEAVQAEHRSVIERRMRAEEVRRRADIDGQIAEQAKLYRRGTVSGDRG
ncbi:DUF4407 domain-containing protein [Nocardiopsis lucentensis]|uniref:DUF4407 domain-containing protein n=1 Tax=Nocardiopsis lucentensis TaxID=53441 RepID=UPI00034553D1|nr:DUF4407 domain-containing protein [Nocardiopsis lucentensis]